MIWTMDGGRLDQIEEIFDRVVTLPESERAAAAVAACADDGELLRAVRALVAATPSAAAAIRDAVSAEANLFTGSKVAIGRRIGPYRLVSLLGEGGMGAVYAATRDDAQYAKQVAIKIMPHAMGSPAAIARFRDERQMLAGLEHRNIVRLLDGGSTDDDLPYLVMEQIEGKPITAYARDRGLSIRERVALVHEVCGAIQYAHQNLIVHRDIKPSNILVDNAGTPKLLDFGIAKLVTPDAAMAREAKTRTGHALFTPEYASPEQARGDAVSTATDVYSLGAVLFELLVDRPPHQVSGSSMLEMLRVICEVDVARPSAVAPPERRRELAGDLDNILLKALTKDAARRYASIEQLADDLRRYLDGHPVSARVATLGYRARKFVLRNKAGVIAATLVAGTLVGGTVIALRLAKRADENAENALVEKSRAVTETQRAQEEADRARRAEQQVQAQLDEIRAAQTARAAAETQAQLKTNEASMTREQLEEALKHARDEKRLAEQESKRARDAELLAEQAADAEKQTRKKAQALYEQELAKRLQAEAQNKLITTKLPK